MSQNLKKIEVDLHGMNVVGAKKYLLEKVKNCPKSVEEIEVIHGYHAGSALLEMVRSFKHPRVEKKLLSMNFGITTFVMKKS